MEHEVPYIFKENHSWPLPSENFQHFKEKSPLCPVPESIFSIECNPRRDTRPRKRLAWESCTKHIEVIRYELLCLFGCNISEWDVPIICEIGLLGGFIPFGRKHAFAAVGLHRKAKAPNSRKEVDECKPYTTPRGKARFVYLPLFCRGVTKKTRSLFSVRGTERTSLRVNPMG